MLACPHCGSALSESGGTVRCPEGHVFDLARQGYVNLLGPARPPGRGDSAEMVAARERFLSAGHFDPLLAAIAESAAALLGGAGAGGVVDLGGGTGVPLARVLDAAPGRSGVSLDLSPYAARRAARAHARAGAAVCDVWGSLPVRDASAALVVSVLAPRNGTETARALTPGGSALVVAATPAHLAELAEPLGLIAVDEDKRERVDAALVPLRADSARELVFEMELGREDVEALVEMGPSARHVDREALSGAIASLGAPVRTTASVTLRSYRP